MMLYLETALYALQIVSFFFLTAPILVASERQRSLGKNPAWVAGRPGFLEKESPVGLRPIAACGLILLLALIGAAALSSRVALFLIHGPLFLAAAAGLMIRYARKEAVLRSRIPEDPVRRASLRPRTLSGFLPAWCLAALGLAWSAILAINAWGFLGGSMAPQRASGNVILVMIFTIIMAAGARQVLRRPSYRISEETDAVGRSLELGLIVGVSGFLAAVCLYHGAGSLGSHPLFIHPPTLVHAWVEGKPWSWPAFLERTEYRWVEGAAALFIAALGPWLSGSRFYKRILAVDFRKVTNTMEV